MHIPDGFMNVEVSAVAGVASLGALSYSIRRGSALPEVATPLPGLVAAFVFAMQMVNFPIAGGTSGHVLGAALAAALIGPWLAIICMAVVFIVQALVFADGGITALGLNVLNGAVIPVLIVSLAFAATRPLVRRRTSMYLVVAGVAGWLSIVAAALLIVLEFSLGGSAALSLRTFSWSMLTTHAVIGLAEAAVTVGVLKALLASRPDLVAGAALS